MPAGTTVVGRVDARLVRNARRVGAGVLAGVVLAGCGSVQVRHPDGRTEYQSREAFAAYVERVFRYHNRVVNDLIVATSLGDESAFEDASLIGAEAAMAAACQPLNDTVSATIEGRDTGFFQRLALPEAVPACEAASRRVEALLPVF